MLLVEVELNLLIFQSNDLPFEKIEIVILTEEEYFLCTNNQFKYIKWLKDLVYSKYEDSSTIKLQAAHILNYRIEAFIEKHKALIAGKFEEGTVKKEELIYPKKIEYGAMLFIGLNNQITNVQEGFEDKGITRDDEANLAVERISEIAEYCRSRWTYLNMLFFEVHEQLNPNNVLKQIADYEILKEQIKVAYTLIHKVNPEIIIVRNELSANLLGFGVPKKYYQWSKSKITYDSNLQSYLLNEIPVFFMNGNLDRSLELDAFRKLKHKIKEILISRAKENIEEIRIRKKELVLADQHVEATVLRDKEKRSLERLTELTT